MLRRKELFEEKKIDESGNRGNGVDRSTTRWGNEWWRGVTGERAWRGAGEMAGESRSKTAKKKAMKSGKIGNKSTGKEEREKRKEGRVKEWWGALRGGGKMVKSHCTGGKERREKNSSNGKEESRVLDRGFVRHRP